MWRRSWSIRAWLGGLVVAVALPLLLLLAWVFVSQLRRERVEARDTALRIARDTAADIRAQSESSEALLQQMARRPAIRDFDGHADQRLQVPADAVRRQRRQRHRSGRHLLSRQLSLPLRSVARRSRRNALR